MTSPDWQARLVRNARRGTIRHRNWPVVRRLTVVTVALLLASLPAELWLGEHALTITCYVGAAIAGATLLAHLFVKRLWVARPPTR